MSITFYVEMGPVTGFELRCWCGIVGFETADWREMDKFQMNLRENPVQFEGCTSEDCLIYGPARNVLTADPETPSVNMSEVNAAEILEVLGVNMMEEGSCGSFSVEDLEGRLLMADALAPVSELRPTFTHKGETGPTNVYCAREEGYVQNKLARIAGVVAAAKELNRMVVWN